MKPTARKVDSDSRAFWISDFKAIQNLESIRSILGGKGFHLAWLQKRDFPVPHFGVLTADAYQSWGDLGHLPESLLSSIQAMFRSKGTEYVAVRSSMTAEDGAETSYAGIMESYLYVPVDEVGQYILKVYESLKSQRVEEYQKKKNVHEGADTPLEKSSQKMAVVIQEMFPSEVSGVAFSRAPVGNSARMTVDAGYGLGEGIVSGLVPTDLYYLDRWGNVIQSQLRLKTSQIHFDPKEKATRELPIESEKAKSAALSPDQLRVLADSLLKLENEIGHPVDIEWAFQKERFALLQVRPITQAFPKLKYFVDTNLSESYPGRTSPLTAEYVCALYTDVFRDTAIRLGFTRGKMRKLDPYFKSLLGYHGGHLYYDLINYYTVLGALPKGETNISTWHRMIGGSAHLRIPYELLPLTFFEKMKIFGSLIGILISRKSTYEKLYSDFDQWLKAYEEESEKLSSADAKAWCRFLAEKTKTLEGSGLTALNDLLLMNGLKVLTSLVDPNAENSSRVISELKTKVEVDSVKPLNELMQFLGQTKNPSGLSESLRKIRAEIAKDPEQERPPLVAYSALETDGFTEEYRFIIQFLDRFGDRSYEELKLESKTFRQAPQDFLDLVIWLIQGKSRATPLEAHQSSDLTPSFEKESSPLKGWWIRQISSFTQSTIEVREKTRLMRGQYYGNVRRCLYQIHLRLRREMNLPGLAWEDFCGIRISQLRQYGAGEIDLEKLKGFIESQKSWHKETVDYPECFAHPEDSDGPHAALLPYFMDDDHQADVFNEITGAGGVPGEMRGLGVSPGEIEGLALVITDPREALQFPNLQEYILITKTTDPSWIFVMSQSKGLISERGSLLSHTAIIGRELSIPTVVSVPHVTQQLKTGDLIRINGSNGKVQKISAKSNAVTA
jgi:rifampicin phosphotransferase